MGAVIAAAFPGLARADSASPQPAAATVSAVTILVPGQDPVTLALTQRRLLYPNDGTSATGSIAEVYRVAQSATATPGVPPQAASQATIQWGELFGGEIRFRLVDAQAGIASASDGKITASAQSQFGKLVVLGTQITDPQPGQQVTLADWGTLTIDAVSTTDAGLPKGDGAQVVALDVTLTSDHDGLAAGSEIQIGSAMAAASPAPPPASGGSGHVASGTPSPPHSPSSPRVHRSHQGSLSIPHRASHHHSGTTSQPRRHHQRPAAPKRPVVHHPVTLSGSVSHRIVQAAESQIGWPYVWGGESEAEGGFDCSGLVDYAFARAGRTLPGRPTAQVLWLWSQPISRHMLKPADLVFLLNRNGYAFHVGMYAGHGMVVVAAHHGVPVELQPLSATPWVAYGRLWQRPVATPPEFLVAVAATSAPTPHPRPRVDLRATSPQAPAASPATPEAVVEAAIAHRAPKRRPVRHPSPAATAARDEDLRTPAGTPEA
ncbi:MAG: choice-of-anchor P family protein [Gaiellales bacterium]